MGRWWSRTSLRARRILSNVVAIAAGGIFSLGVITASPPASVFIQPHGRIEEMVAEADLVFKGQVLSSDVDYQFGIAEFVRWKHRATKFKIDLCA